MPFCLLLISYRMWKWFSFLHKQNITIDSCLLKSDSGFLQQASFDHLWNWIQFAILWNFTSFNFPIGIWYHWWGILQSNKNGVTVTVFIGMLQYKTSWNRPIQNVVLVALVMNGLVACFLNWLHPISDDLRSWTKPVDKILASI